MFFHTRYNSPIGWLTVVAEGEELVGAWFDRQKYFAQGIGGIGREDSGQPLLSRCREWLDRYFNGERPDLDLPLAPRVTLAQQAIWDEIRQIRYGQVVACSELRLRVNRSRQFARLISKMTLNIALLRNPFAVFVPTHRVVGANGSLKNYPAGLDKKIWLLQHEGVDTSLLYLPAALKV